MECILELLSVTSEKHLHACKVCSRKVECACPDPGLVHRQCPGHPVPDNWKPSSVDESEQRGDKPQRTMRMAWSAAVAHAKWVKAGMPRRTEAEIAETFALCQACKFFQPNEAEPDKGHCGVCGCGLKKAGGIGAKNMMATEHCPLTPPKW